MTRKRDWRWVSRDDNAKEACIWPVSKRAIWKREGRYYWAGTYNDEAPTPVVVCARELVKLGARIRPGECKRVRITLEVLPDERAR